MSFKIFGRNKNSRKIKAPNSLLSLKNGLRVSRVAGSTSLMARQVGAGLASTSVMGQCHELSVILHRLNGEHTMCLGGFCGARSPSPRALLAQLPSLPREGFSSRKEGPGALGKLSSGCKTWPLGPQGSDRD